MQYKKENYSRGLDEHQNSTTEIMPKFRPAPEWIEITNCKILSDPIRAFAEIIDFLKNNGVTFTANHNKHKIACIANNLTTMEMDYDKIYVIPLCFRVFIWRDSAEIDSGNHIIEVQKRRGCVIQFNEIYERLMKCIVDRGHVVLDE